MNSKVLQSAALVVELRAGELDVARVDHVHHVGHDLGRVGDGRVVGHVLLQNLYPRAIEGFGVLHTKPFGGPKFEKKLMAS